MSDDELIKKLSGLIDEKLQPIQRSIDDLDKKTDERFDSVNEAFVQINGHFDFLYKANEKREEEYLVINNQLERIDGRLEKINTRLDNLENDMTVVKNAAESHEDRISELQKKIA